MAALDPRPFDVAYIENPSQEALRDLAREHTPAVLVTRVGSLDKISRNKARMAQYTYVVAPSEEADRWSHQTIEPERAAELIARQRSYIEERGRLLAIDGYLGVGPRAVPCTWLYTLEGANIAGMQQVLAFSRDLVEGEGWAERPFRPRMRVIYTPDLFLEDMPGRQAIVVDLRNWTTHVMGPDYFGESKKGALRMLNHLVYQEGGLVLHAGAKAVTLPGGQRVTMTVMGLSGTGKTTTTFSEQGELTEPVQDDMVCLWPGGELSVTENGCFAKTEGLSPETEPVLHAGTTSPQAWVENVYLTEEGDFDFSKGALSPEEVARYREIFLLTGASEANLDAYVSGRVRFEEVVDEQGIPKDGWDFVVWTQNGRSIVPMRSIPGAADLSKVPPVHSMGILNRDEGEDAAMPGLVRFVSPEQAAGYFMLGETSKTSAAGKERGKTRSPFTQPFFPGDHRWQAERFRELAATMGHVTFWLMNTGYVGGDARAVARGEAIKVKIRHSSALLEALLKGEVHWAIDPDFGYEVVDVDHPGNAALLERVPVEILAPRRFFERTGRMDVYRGWVARMKEERRRFLERFGVERAIVQAVCGRLEADAPEALPPVPR